METDHKAFQLEIPYCGERIVPQICNLKSISSLLGENHVCTEAWFFMEIKEG